MSEAIIVVIVLTFLCLALLAGIPVAFSLLGSGIIGLLLLKSPSVVTATLASSAYQSSAQYLMIVIPLFLFMSNLAFYAGIGEDAFLIAQRWVGRLPGGLAIATVFATAVFSAISGASIAAAAIFSRVAIGEMRRYGYSARLAAGTVAAAATIDILIPPSVGIVLYGATTGQSVGKLLIAGILPGILSGTMYVVLILLLAFLKPNLVPKVSRYISSAGRSVNWANSARLTILILVVLGGIYLGVFTPTEAAAIGGLFVFAVAIFELRHGRLSELKRLYDSSISASSTTAMVFAIFVGAFVFTFFLASVGFITSFTEWALSFNAPKFLIPILILIVFIPLGMFLDSVSIILITTPIVYPLVTGLGYDGIWWGIISVKTIAVGLVTPPLGMSVFVVAGATKMKVQDVFLGALLFVPFDFITIALMFAFPQITLWLPSSMG
jgi:C4-dicarboxylate transporter, DctM subunit